MSFPVFQDAQGARTHEALEFKSLKNLAESVQSYGVSASFTLAVVERLAAIAMTPLDWQSTAKACLAMGTYLNWKSLYADFAQQQARLGRMPPRASQLGILICLWAKGSGWQIKLISPCKFTIR